MFYGISYNMLTSHIVFNVPHDLIHDQYYPLHIKTTNFCFTFAPVIGNSIIFNYPRFLTFRNLVVKCNWYEVLVVNALLKLFGNFQAMNSMFGYIFHIT